MSGWINLNKELNMLARRDKKQDNVADFRDTYIVVAEVRDTYIFLLELIEWYACKNIANCFFKVAEYIYIYIWRTLEVAKLWVR